jgi:hypothetical protein
MIKLFARRLYLIGCVLLLCSQIAFADQTVPASKTNKPVNKKSEQAKPAKPLLPEQIALRDQLRRVVAIVRKQNFNTSENDVGEMLDFCLAFGCSTEITDVANNRRLNGITCVCWNLPCAGYTPLSIVGGHLAPRVGYGHQQSSSQMAAMLALSEVPATYPARSGEITRTVADIIEGEKLSCLAGTDMALKLVALATYADDHPWKNALGESWDIDKVVASELDRPLSTTPHEGVYRWMGISAALKRYERNRKPLSEDMQRAKQFETESMQYALRVQNSGGSWGPAVHRDYATTLSHTGFMLEWLAMAMTDEQLADPQVARSVEFVVGFLNTAHYQVQMQTMTAKEISAVMHTVHALNVYDARLYAPADAVPLTATAAPATAPK